MSWFEQPVRRAPRKIDPQEIERRRQALLDADCKRKRKVDVYYHSLSPDERRALTQKRNKRRQLTAKWRAANYQRTTSGIPASRVIEAWHTDSTGCRARVVGCDA